MKGRSHGVRAVSIFISMLLGGCSLAEPVNVALTRYQRNDEPHRFTASNIGGRPVILVAISGGGSRATALGLSILKALRGYGYDLNGQQYRLVDDIRAVSSVSGGSVIAAYFVLAGPDRMDAIRKDFLEQDNMGTLEWEGASPVTWFRLIFTHFTRIEAFQKLLTQRLFGDTTFGSINTAERPILILNSTDMSSGEVFAFTPEMFDNICSDLSSLSLAAGVAASADFPVALSPMTVRNYSKDCAHNVEIPGWVSYALSTPSARFDDLEEFKRARYAASLRHLDERGTPTADPTKAPYRDIEYLHLLDGGVADNIGAHSLIPLYAKNYGAGGLFNAIDSGDLRQLVIVTINARSDAPNSIDQDPDTPGTIASISSVTSVPIDSTTAAVSALVREAGSALVDQQHIAPKESALHRLQIYDIAIDFDQIPDSQRKLRDVVKQIPTTWSLTTTQLDAVDEVGQILLKENPCFQKLLLDLHVKQNFVDQNRTSSCITRPPS